MNIAEVLGSPVQDERDPVVPHPPACSAPSIDRQDPPHRSSFATRRALVVAAVAVVVGAAGGWLASSVRTGESGATPPRSPSSFVPAEVAGAAEMFTSLYLAGNKSNADIAAFYAGPPPQPTTTWINATATIGGATAGDEMWNVIVVVDSLEKVNDRYEAVALSYYVVPISLRSGRPIATGAPGRIPPPTAAPQPEKFTESIAADQATTAARFVELYLTGGDDLARYLSATALIPGFAIPPYASAVATAQGADASGRIRVAVAATNERGTIHQLEYIVTLYFDGTVWEVSAVSAGTL